MKQTMNEAATAAVAAAVALEASIASFAASHGWRATGQLLGVSHETARQFAGGRLSRRFVRLDDRLNPRLPAK